MEKESKENPVITNKQCPQCGSILFDCNELLICSDIFCGYHEVKQRDSDAD
jgi:ribosomal protein S27AE